MTLLSLSLLGPFNATHDDQPLNNFKTNKVQALLIYLAVERSPIRRESLLTLLWPGMPEKSARHNLSQTLYALRKILQTPPNESVPDEIQLVLADRQTIQINPNAAVDTDLYQLDQLIDKTKTHPHKKLEGCQSCTQALEQGVSFYRGDFQTDFYLEDSNVFEEWTEAVRESYRTKIINVLVTLADIATQKADYEANGD